MKNIPKEKLVQALKILYKLWNREHDSDSDWPSKHYIEWEAGDPYRFYYKYEKQLGLGRDADDYYYWMNALGENENWGRVKFLISMILEKLIEIMVMVKVMV